MVLQNKYKARASRRYKATHNIEPRDNTKSKHGEHAESASNQQEDNSGDTSGLPKTSNAWRYQEPESQDEEEEEPHVDLTSLNQRIAKMDVNERMQFEKAHSDEADTGEGIFYESAPTSKVQTISADQVEQMKKEIESADAERGAYPANRTPQPLPPPAPAAHEVQWTYIIYPEARPGAAV